ncbi:MULTISPECIES: GNAT family N-acetyltransferase [unclassified Streptomyces]|uniref:GNAT family N-acetyltransferase n=1 Tax=unclassified Streptomyces TaxID=2593676 RepID=UPI00336A5929
MLFCLLGAHQATMREWVEIMVSGDSEASSEFELWDLIRNPDKGLARDFYDNVLLPSFTRDELIPREELEEALTPMQGMEASILLALDGSQNVVGGVAAEWYRRSRVLLVSYLAVRPSCRGSGIGSRLGKVVPEWVRERSPLLTVGEVEPPNRIDIATDHGDPIARLRLFSRWQGNVLRMPFLQPRLAPDRQRVPLLLVAFYLNPAASRREGNDVLFSSAVLASFLDEYFAACEGEGREFMKDPEYVRLQNFLRSSQLVLAVPISDYLEVHGLGP